MNTTFIIDTFIKALHGVPVTLGIMVVAILLSFLPALFLALGQNIFSYLSCLYSRNTTHFVNFIFL